MLIIAILILLLAVNSSLERDYNYLTDYVKFNRVVFIMFIVGGYLAYNVLNLDALNTGIGIYGGVFKITVLSQVFDIILFMTGAIISILICFIPYNLKKYDDFKSIEYMVENYNEKIIKEPTKFNFKNYYIKFYLISLDILII